MLTKGSLLDRQPGKSSFYNDEKIINVQISMHEFGHNLGLRHSGEDIDQLAPGYGDITGYMGYSIFGRNNLKKCFNAAKSFELEWYSTGPDRVESIDLALNEDFSGKLIGVADYNISSTDHTLILEIKNSNSSIPSYFLTYNRAKGINKDTAEAANQVTIVQGAAEEKSHLIAKVDPNAGLTFENYHDGRNLIITFGAAAQDGGVDYAYVYFRHRL